MICLFKDSYHKFISGKLARSSTSLMGYENSLTKSSSSVGSAENIQIPRLLPRSATIANVTDDSFNNSGLNSAMEPDSGYHNDSLHDSMERSGTPNLAPRETLTKTSPSLSVVSHESTVSDLAYLRSCPLNEPLIGTSSSGGELILAPMQSRGFPLHVQVAGSKISWVFRSEPKSIQFALVFNQFGGISSDTANSQDSESVGSLESGTGSSQGAPTQFHVIVPLITCKSHLEPVTGDVLVKTPGVYTVYFDNSFSKYTAKKIEYSLSISRS